MFYKEQNRITREVEEEERNAPYGKAIELTDELFDEILRRLLPPPRNELATRAFQQHIDMGLCWNDSFFMMVFEAAATKPIIIGLLKEYFAAMKETGGTTFRIHRDQLTAIARLLKRIRRSEQPLPVWEALVLALQRYLLLGLLFVKEAQPRAIPLLARRPSIWGSKYNYIHELLKYGMFCEYDSGLSKRRIVEFMNQMGNLLGELSEKRVGLEVALNPIVPSKVKGYYFSIQGYSEERVRQNLLNQRMFLKEYAPHPNTKIENLGDFYGAAHILCFFLAEDGWYLYDDEAGVVRLSEAHSAAVNAVGLESVVLLKSATHSIYECSLYDGTKFRVTQENPSNESVEGRVIRALTIKSASFRMVEGDGDGARGAGGANGGTGGGGRKTRRRRHHTISSGRSHKYACSFKRCRFRRSYQKPQAKITIGR